jgi:hypothetical protein
MFLSYIGILDSVYHVAVANESSVVGERCADAANVRWTVGSGMSSDPEVVTSSLDGLAIEWLAGVAGTQGKGTTAFLGELRHGRSAAAVLGR